MATPWEPLGQVASVVQLTGLDAARLIGMIVKAASTARMHKKNCRQFAQHLKLIGNLLEQLRISDLKKYPETREPLEQLEDALRRAYVLVNSCHDRSYLYLLAMGWSIVYQFRRAQSEIDRYLRIIPLITLVDNQRVRERVEYIEKDQCEYTFDEEDIKVQEAILSTPWKDQKMILEKTLSSSYPNMSFDEALQRENEKLQIELQRSQTNFDSAECQLIQLVLGVTETVASNFPEDTGQQQNYKAVESDYLHINADEGYSFNGNYHSQPDATSKALRSLSLASSSRDLLSNRESHRHEEWHSDLLGCCSDPFLCMKTCFFPCGTFSKIASVAKSRKKLRKMLNITGGLCDDFLSHLLCCCCSLVQEWREVEFRGISGVGKTKTSPPSSQCMEG